MSACDSTQRAIEYRLVEAHPLYRVGNDGTVWSSKTQKTRHGDTVIAFDDQGTRWRQLRPVDLRGYLAVCVDGQIKKIHILVLETFVGPRPGGAWALHNDGNRLNNSLTNLRWGTPSDNAEDRRKHGRGRFGTANPSVKLTDADVLSIRRRYQEGTHTIRQLREEYSVTDTAVRYIINRKTWKHLPP